MTSRHRRFAAAVIFAVLPLGGCLFRVHHPSSATAPIALKTATKSELVKYVNAEAGKIQTMQATLDIDTTVGEARKPQIGGYLWLRKPAMLRMQGLLPIIRSRAFEMVSDGQEFKLWIPPKNRFVVGHNKMLTPDPQHPLENLRPQIIYDALLLREIDENDAAVLENGAETIVDGKGRKYEQPDYMIDIIRGQWPNVWLSRKIVFSRLDLLPNRQVLYDDSAKIVTDVRYSDYKDYEAVRLPSHIEIRRPEERYEITLTIGKMDINHPLANDIFVLEQPQGVQVIDLDETDRGTHARD